MLLISCGVFIICMCDPLGGKTANHAEVFVLEFKASDLFAKAFVLLLYFYIFTDDCLDFLSVRDLLNGFTVSLAFFFVFLKIVLHLFKLYF